ncbi:hypothetical protein L227DRAFT_130341 [Lentinus tigrinus ALCF2SS1-6]|uniref:Uncharacterized protein n=1 Tax=Lentinus tigrinus ALCF2SS1-6 TaxID=1328759 RepID=A0A5C2SQA5_9APHY|nr:hypothetical protein L227DRAFT_130341 [Lentinus tigrinus ALCF2SS1-6]
MPTPSSSHFSAPGRPCIFYFYFYFYTVLIHTSLVAMCHNVIDGRLHLLCQHFIPMSTRQQDCLRPNCLFSRNHAHPVGCRSNSCARMMQPPQRNPIRISESLLNPYTLSPAPESKPPASFHTPPHPTSSHPTPQPAHLECKVYLASMAKYSIVGAGAG